MLREQDVIIRITTEFYGDLHKYVLICMHVLYFR